VRSAASLAVAAVLGASAADAQQPPAPTTATPAVTAEAPAPEPYTYQIAGRRDPFLNPLGTGVEERPSGRRPDGVAGLGVAEIAVRGVLQSRGALVAMISGPDNRTYIVHEGDKLFDATIKTITPQGLVMTQDVKDPLSSVKRREIQKLLRSLEDGKE